MTPADLSAIEARANAATAGPWTDTWEYCGDPTETRYYYLFADAEVPEEGEGTEPMWKSVYVGCGRKGCAIGAGEGGFVREEDAAFAAHARSDIPALVAEVRRLTNLLEKETYEPWRQHP